MAINNVSSSNNVFISQEIQRGGPNASKKQKVEAAPDSKGQHADEVMQSIARQAFPSLLPPVPPVSFSSSSSQPLALQPPFSRPLYASHLAPSMGRGRPKATAAAADAPQVIELCSYQKAAKQTDENWTNEGVLFRNFAIRNEASMPIKPLGKGHSFTCFTIETSEGPKVIKIFTLFIDPLIFRKQVGRRNPKAVCDQRMDVLKNNFDFCRDKGVPCALILNAATLKDDGYVLQEFAPEKAISWSKDSGDLSIEQTKTLGQFLVILNLAFEYHDRNCWDLYPRNFGLTDQGLTLLDFTDESLDGQWQMFPNAIRAWANQNSSAQRIITTHLQNCLTDPRLIFVENQIKTLIDTLGAQ